MRRPALAAVALAQASGRARLAGGAYQTLLSGMVSAPCPETAAEGGAVAIGCAGPDEGGGPGELGRVLGESSSRGLAHAWLGPNIEGDHLFSFSSGHGDEGP